MGFGGVLLELLGAYLWGVFGARGRLLGASSGPLGGSFGALGGFLGGLEAKLE